jgi:hypothetical protein
MQNGSDFIKLRNSSKKYPRNYHLDPDIANVCWTPSKKGDRARSKLIIVIIFNSSTLNCQNYVFYNFNSPCYIFRYVYIYIYNLLKSNQYFDHVNMSRCCCKCQVVVYSLYLTIFLWQAWRASQQSDRLSYELKVRILSQRPPKKNFYF